MRAELVRAPGPELENAADDKIEILALLVSANAWTKLRTTDGLGPDEASSQIERAILRIMERA